MNKQMIAYIIGSIMKIEAALMLLPMIVGLLYKDNVMCFVITILLLVLLGFALTGNKKRDDMFLAKDGYIAVGLSWIVLSAFGALPFVISGEIPSFIDAFFEIVSGFTTTGSSILTDVEAMSKGLLFWRSFSHWIGGMGILVFMLAILPVASGKSMHLMRAESPGPSVGKLVPKMRQTASLLYKMYIFLSVVMVIALLLAGMPLYDALIHMFGTAGTGGFSIWADSVAHYNSPLIELIITIFLFLFATNFNIYYFILIKDAKSIFKNDEIKTYFCVFVFSILMIAINVYPLYGTVLESLRYSSFQVASIMSTAGFASANFDTWPTFSKIILFLLMFIGGCAGSTGGGIKVSRFVLIFKSFKHEINQLIRPREVNNVFMDGHPVDEKVRRNTVIYFALAMIIVGISILLISLDGYDFATTISAVAVTFNNVGPGFGMVGPLGSFAEFSNLSKLVLSFDMLLGRLEIFPILMLFMPQLYKRR